MNLGGLGVLGAETDKDVMNSVVCLPAVFDRWPMHPTNTGNDRTMVTISS